MSRWFKLDLEMWMGLGWVRSWLGGGLMRFEIKYGLCDEKNKTIFNDFSFIMKLKNIINTE